MISITAKEGDIGFKKGFTINGTKITDFEWTLKKGSTLEIHN